MRTINTTNAQDARRHSALLIGNYRATLAVIRSLARDGYHVILGVHGNTHGNERSRYCAETWRHPSLDRTGDAFNRALTAFLEQRPDVRLVFPVTEEAVVHFARRPCPLPDGTVLVAASTATVEQCQDKAKMLELATRAGVAMAPWAIVRGAAGMDDATRAVGYPCVLRPIVAPARLCGRKALIVSSPDELQSMLPTWPAEHDRLLVQRYVAGPRHNVYFAARRGEVSHCVQVRILRGDRADGTGLAVEGVSVALDDALDRATRRLVRHLDYTGVGCAQFLVSDSGEHSFLEVNPRLGANCSIVGHCGVDLPAIAADLASGLPVAASSGYTVGARYAWLFGDLAGLQHELASGRIGAGGALRWLGRTALNGLRADAHLTFSAADPRPALANYSRKGRSLLHVALRRARRSAASHTV